jgi:RNA polymerase sigma-70 factor (ECF subfamily)
MAWLREIDIWLIEQVLPAEPRYCALAVRLVGPAEADDLVQEAYARLLSLQTWQDIASPVAFTHQIIRNLALDRLRRASLVRIENVAALDLAAIADPAPDPHRVASAASDLARIVALVDQLPPQCRKVVRLRKFEGRSPREIAEMLGLSVSTVEKHLAKGLAAVTKGMAGDLAMPEERDRPGSWERRRPRA